MRLLLTLILSLPLYFTTFEQTIPDSNYANKKSKKILYGLTTWGGEFDKGTLFSYNLTTQNESVLFSFNGVLGERPTGNLIQGNDKVLYGMALGGGVNNCGVLFSYDIVTGKYSVLININGKNGKGSGGSVLLGNDSVLYGTTEDGGSYDKGVLFSFNPKNMQYKVLFNFDSIQGERPCGQIIQASDGRLYGMTEWGGQFSHKSSLGNGVIYSYDLGTRKYRVILNFNGDNGRSPADGLLQAKDGDLYGMTHDGGKYDKGVIFRYNISSMRYTKLFNFNDTNGAAPFNSILQTNDGNMYGVAFGGNEFNGIIFQFNPKTLVETVQINFDSLSMPYSGLTPDNEGNLYGMNNRGGKYDFGYIYCYNPSATKFSIISNFTGNNGKYPNNSLLFVIKK